MLGVDGCGVGAAALCLGWRVPGLDLCGLEVQPDYADLARRNGQRNKISLAVDEGDLRQMPRVACSLVGAQHRVCPCPATFISNRIRAKFP